MCVEIENVSVACECKEWLCGESVSRESGRSMKREWEENMGSVCWNKIYGK